MDKFIALILILLMTGITSCDKQCNDIEQTLCVSEGGNRFKPYCPRIGDFDYLKYGFFFGNESVYILEDSSEQYDINKLTGISFDLISNHQNSGMIGFRYNTVIDRFEFFAYYHVDGQVGWSDALVSIPVGSYIETYLGINYVMSGMDFQVKYLDNEYNYFVAYDWLEVTNDTKREINTWHGGTTSAPYEYCITRYDLNGFNFIQFILLWSFIGSIVERKHEGAYPSKSINWVGILLWPLFYLK
jgi:hypothetical protein